MNALTHIPVLLDKVVEALSPKDGEIFVDGTFGGGGYSVAILDAGECRVYGIDRDPGAIEAGRDLEEKYKGRLKLLEGRFSAMESLLKDVGVEKVDGIALDIGVSSRQLEEASRGFSFQKDGPLDMRMSGRGQTAEEVINTLPKKELADIFYRYGEENRARHIANVIVSARKEEPIKTTAKLAEIVAKAKSGRGASKIHPATKVFQALRIYVNQELQELEDGLRAAERILKEGGRLAVVSFHSLEDRIVKEFLNTRSGNIPQGSRHSPPDATPGKWREPTFILPQRKAVKPGRDEQRENPRARSARLRVAVRSAASVTGHFAQKEGI